MTILLAIVHVLVCLFLILVVLLQTGKGADVAAAFGGSSQTAFGARGASTFLSKMTTVSAVVFMLTSLVLSVMSSGPTSSVLENVPAAQAPVGTPSGTKTVPIPGRAEPSKIPAAGSAGSAAPGMPPPAAPAPANPPAEKGSAPPAGSAH